MKLEKVCFQAPGDLSELNEHRVFGTAKGRGLTLCL